MTAHPSAQARILELSTRIRENIATAEDLAELQSLVLQDEAARRQYVQLMHLHASLLWCNTVNAPAAPVAPHALQAAPVGRWRGALSYWNQPLVFSIVFATSALFAGLTLLGVLQYGAEQTPHQTVAASYSTAPTAYVASARDCVWNDEASVIVAGDQLAAGRRLDLASGRVTLRLPKGVEVVLEGPAFWEFRGETACFLGGGQLTARVPERARGFVVETPAGRVIDLGTEFGVRVEEQGATEVHVFSGQVNFVPISSSPQTAVSQILNSAEAMRFDPQSRQTARLSSIAANFSRSSAAEPAALLGFYPFDGDARDRSGQLHDPISVQEISFPPGFSKEAAHFAGSRTSFIDLPIDASPTSMPRLTWGAWVRPAVVDAMQREVFSTDNDGFDRVLGLDPRVAESSTWAAFTGRSVTPFPGRPPQAGHWYFLAVVYDEPAKSMTLYRKDLSSDSPFASYLYATVHQTEFGPSQKFVRLGGHATQYNMPFQGEMDNVFLFAAALSRKQIEAICDGGADAILNLAGISASPDSTDEAKAAE